MQISPRFQGFPAKPSRHLTVIAVLALACLAILVTPAQAQETVCAVVKIEIRQELTLERQAFEARMRITNGLDTLSLDDVGVEVLFEDETGDPVLASTDPNHPTALFFLRLDSLEGIDNVTGSGSIPANGVAEITWLIIPALGAGGSTSLGKMYGIGATLSYRFGGQPEVVNVAPDIIRVKPMPELRLDYFLPRDVFGDDPLTPETEVIEPFDLGVLVSNTGAGVARGLKIESAQPRIVENLQGLLINFELLGSSVDDQAVSNSLLADFGDIEPGASRTARWLMSTSLNGTFISFDADYAHADELGGQLTSLLSGVHTHRLARSVRVDLPGRDEIRDFLADEGASYRVFESDGAQAQVQDASVSASLTTLPAQQGQSRYSLSLPATQAPVFVRVQDPNAASPGTYDAWRSDGKRIDSANIWRFRVPASTGGYTRYIGLFDSGTTGQYELRFDGAMQNQAPQITPVPPIQATVGVPLSLNVAAVDPDGDDILMTASGLPASASFMDLGGGQGQFAWTPQTDQVGTTTVRVTATDGALSATVDISIEVQPVDSADSDGDGMDDAWELEHFGDLERDGSGDFDSDSASDLEEFQHQGDPGTEDRPTRAQALWPQSDELLAQPPTELVVANATGAADAELNYRFELFEDETLANLLDSGVSIEEAVETSWQLTANLQAGHEYHWRAGAHDGATPGDWTYGRFRLVSASQEPSFCRAEFPSEAAAFAGERPQLSVMTGGVDEHRVLDYRFVLFDDPALENPLILSPLLRRAGSGEVSWRVYPALEMDRTYYWRAAVRLESGDVYHCPVASFSRVPGNDAPDGYYIASPAADERASIAGIDIRIAGGTDADGDPMQFELELDREPTFNGDALQQLSAQDAGQGTAVFELSDLQAASRYYIRVRATDDVAAGPWRYSHFWTSASAELLHAPIQRLPRDATWVDSPRPTLVLAGVEHPHPAALSMEFQLFADNLQGELLWSGQGGFILPVPMNLTDRRWYAWRARVVDGLEASEWSAVSRFFVIDNGVDDAPSFEWIGLDSDRLQRPGPVELQWLAEDPDSSARIHLYFEPESAALPPVAIVTDLFEDSDSHFTWDASLVAEGRYRIFARIEDGTSSVTQYAPAVVELSSAGFELEAPARETDEQGADVEVRVRLASQPLDLVIVPFAVSDLTEARVEPEQLVFGPDTWNQYQTVTVVGLADQQIDGDQSYSLEVGPAESEDEGFHGLQRSLDGFVNRDTDTAQLELQAVNGEIITSETALNSQAQLRLSSRPAASVIVQLQSSDTSEALLSPETIEIQPENWSTWHVISVLGQDDDELDGDVAYQVRVVAVESLDANFAAATLPELQGVNLDNDSPRILVTPRDGLLVDEYGASVSVQVALNAAPEAPVQLSLSSSDEGEGLLSSVQLEFAPDNWNIPQSFLITGVADDEPDGDQVFDVRIGPALSSDPRFAGIGPETLEVTNLDRRIAGLQVGEVALEGWLPGDVIQVPLDQVFRQTPLVFANWISSDKMQHGLRLVSVSPTQVELQLLVAEESDSPGSDGRLVFLAIEAGEHRLPDGRRVRAHASEVAGRAADDNWSTMNFGQEFASAPQMLAQVQVQRNILPGGGSMDGWLSAAVDELDGAGALLALEGNPAAGVLLAEQIAILAIESGSQGVFQTAEGWVEYESLTMEAEVRELDQHCNAVALSSSRTRDVLALASLSSRSETTGVRARLCAAERSALELAVNTLTPPDSQAARSSENATLLAFSRPFAFELREAAGILVDDRFGLRTYEDGLGIAFAVRLSQMPSAGVTVGITLESGDALEVEPQELNFTADDWDRPVWVRAQANNQDLPVESWSRAVVRLDMTDAQDPAFSSAAPTRISVDIGARGSWQRTVDNADAGFHALGAWQVSDEGEGFLGSDYRIHEPNGESPDALVLDNGEPGYSTYGAWTSSTSGSGYLGADYQYRFPGDPPDARILDDEDALFEGRSWLQQSALRGYYGIGYHATRAKSGPHSPSSAVWSLADFEPGRYRIYAHWTASGNRATNAPFTIRHTRGSDVVRVDQRTNGGIWNLLGEFDLDIASSVVLSNEANGWVVADAIKLIPVDAQPNTASWEFTLPAEGDYEVFARWTSAANRASNAPYTVYHEEGQSEVRVDQRTDNATWVSLGVYPFNVSTPARIDLDDRANGVVSADAIRMLPVDARPNRATWQMSGLVHGMHRVWARWPANDIHAGNAPYTANFLTHSRQTSVDQTQAPGRWNPLSTGFAVPQRPLTIYLSDRADGYVVADSVRSTDLAMQGPRGAIVFDDVDASLHGSWSLSMTLSGYFDQGYRIASGGLGQASLRWSMAEAKPGSYRIYARWPASSGHASNAPFQILHSEGDELVRVDQRARHAEWVLLGEYSLDADSAVLLRDDADGPVVGDAIRIEPAYLPVISP